MDTISGFWTGAVAVSDQLDLEALADEAGGWAALARADAGALVALGVPEMTARLWLASAPFTTAARALTRGCVDYPSALAAIARPPPVVFVEGDLECFRTGAVAIVGTRRCTPHGASVAHKIAYECASAGLVVVSGLARGIDRHAHLGALAARGRTVAVLAHGLAHTAPPSHVHLRRQIVESGGALITTWPDPCPPARWTFPIRNRWIAALSRRVVIVEAPEHSGSLLTATHLAELGRDTDLRVVPGPFGVATWRGSAALIAMGAVALCEVESLLADLAVASASAVHPDWLSALISGAPIDEAATIRGVTTAQLLREIGVLEVHGRLVRMPGGRYALGRGTP